MMDRFSKYCMLAVMAGLALGCGAQTAEEPEVVEATEAVVEAEPVLELVEVAAEGSEFDPAVDPAQIPDGAFYCPMETVHFASLEAGTCPTCGMDLVEKVAAVEEEPAEEAEEEDASGQNLT
jgi:hypothetical protein